MAEAVLRAELGLRILGGDFYLTIETRDVNVAEEICRVSGYRRIGVMTLGVLHRGYRFIRHLINAAVNAAIYGFNQVMEIIGSLHVDLHCFTDERFLEVLKDYESGKIEERLQKEFTEVGIEVEGLKVALENMEEVNEKKAAINKRLKQMGEDSSTQGLTQLYLGLAQLSLEQKIKPGIIVQGGVYRCMPSDRKKVYVEATKESAQAGYHILIHGGTAVEAVEAAVRVLEDNEYFNAGCGSSLNNDEQVECEAMIMEGHTLNIGALISGRHFRNPVSLAKKIMHETHHCALSGDGALEFAKSKNVQICKPSELVSELATSRGKADYEHYPEWVEFSFGTGPTKEFPDTVSAVAMDVNGYLACATSTGGMAGKLKGRVGDAALVGCGGYANKNGAATVAGEGEQIMKITLAREVVYNMETKQNVQNDHVNHDQDAQESANEALEKMEQLVSGHGGVIAIDKNGNFGKVFNTETMVWASIKDNTLEFGMEKDEVETEHLEY